MEFAINKQEFAAGLYKALGVVERKSLLNILSHVLVESVSNTEVRLVCTDYEVVLVGTYPAEVVQPGRMTVSAKHLFEVVKALPEQPIHCTRLDNDWVEVRCGSSRFKLAGLSPADFPEQQMPEDLRYFSVSKRILGDLIDRTLFSVSTDETRPSLNGVLMRVIREGDDLRVTMVSTDGHRLSKAEALVGEAGTFDTAAEAILHRKAISELKRCMEGPGETVDIAFQRGNVFFRTDETILQVRKLDETFPDYTKVIPSTRTLSFAMDRVAFRDAIRRIATLTSAKTHIIRVDILPGRLVMTSTNPEAGEGRDELPIDYDGRELTVGFNYRYVLDVLGVMVGDRVDFSINDQYSPGLLTSVDDEGSLFVIMPMRI